MNEFIRMDGKVCVVTGATSGLGLVTARELAARGATVVVTGRDLAKAPEVAARIRSVVPGTRNRTTGLQQAACGR
jgi:NAD(P)-dependent dehydrogenase (short-subunit alcohol dehydrogenase family)